MCIIRPLLPRTRQFSRLSIFLQAPSPIVGANVSTIVPGRFRHRTIPRQFVFCSQIILPISRHRRRKRERQREGKKKRNRKGAAARGSCRDGQDKETLERRVILPLMCVTRSTRPRTHHRRDNGVGVTHGGEMLDGSEPGRAWLATKTATQPDPSLHDHKITS